MADEEGQAAGQDAAQATDQKEPSLKDIMAQMDAIKAAQSGSDRKVKELTEALKLANDEKEKLTKERMTDKERQAYEQEKIKKMLEEKDAEIRSRELALEKASVITELEVPKGLAPYVSGQTREQLISSARSLMDALKAEVGVEVNKRLAGSASTPKAGDAKGDFTRAQLDDMGDWNRIFAMPPGPEKDKAISDRLKAGAGMAD